MRVALGLSYEGGGYEGWQSQPSGNTVQDQLEKALSRFSNEPIRTMCAGRTDAGVHALMQVVHFDTQAERPEGAWVRGPNSLLPRGIAVQWARHMSADFHCRSQALGRRYAYVLLESPVRPSVEAGRVGWVFRPLNRAAMEQAAALLIGEHAGERGLRFPESGHRRRGNVLGEDSLPFLASVQRSCALVNADVHERVCPKHAMCQRGFVRARWKAFSL
jgi:tRNA pseudouridine(38-40) synthase